MGVYLFDPNNAINPQIKAEWERLAVDTEYDANLVWLYILLLVVLFVVFRIVAMLTLAYRTKVAEG